MPDTDTMAGRSRLLRTGVAGGGARRPFLRRALILLAVLGPVVALSVAVAARLLPLDGPGRIAYLAHDRLWLPARAQVWTRIYPYGFLWLVPLVLLGFAALVEWLSPVSLIRGTHRRAVLRASRGGIGRWILLRAASALRRVGITPGFAATVIEESLVEARAPLLEALREGRSGDAARAADLAALWLRLDPGNIAALAAAQELAALSLIADARATPPRPLAHSAPPRTALIEAMAQAWPHIPPLPAPETGPDGRPALPGVATPDGARQTATEVLAGIEADPDSPEALPALLALVLTGGLAAGLGRPEAGLAVFDLWRRVRLGARADLAARMAWAEMLVSFGFWAGLAEPVRGLPDRPDLLTGLLAAETRQQPLGEGFATRGEEA
jgi:hypothetical protein